MLKMFPNVAIPLTGSSPSSTASTVPEFPSSEVFLTLIVAVSVSIAVLVTVRRHKVEVITDKAKESNLM